LSSRSSKSLLFIVLGSRKVFDKVFRDGVDHVCPQSVISAMNNILALKLDRLGPKNLGFLKENFTLFFEQPRCS